MSSPVVVPRFPFRNARVRLPQFAAGIPVHLFSERHGCRDAVRRVRELFPTHLREQLATTPTIQSRCQGKSLLPCTRASCAIHARALYRGVHFFHTGILSPVGRRFICPSRRLSMSLNRVCGVAVHPLLWNPKFLFLFAWRQSFFRIGVGNRHALRAR